MKRFLPLLLFLAPGWIQAQPLKLDSLDKLAAKATDSVNVNLDGSLLRLASRFLSSREPDEAQIKRLVAGLKGVYVRSYEFSKAGQYLESDIEAIRSQLRDARWKRVVEVRGRENADVCLREEADQITGLAVIVAEPTELTVVYIDGPIDLDGLARLEGNFGIPEDFHRRFERRSK